MDLNDRITIPSQVMARQVGEELVILDLASSTYFGLDDVGTRIWQLFSEKKSLGEVCEAMALEYDCPQETLLQDIRKMVDELSAKGLVSRTP